MLRLTHFFAEFLLSQVVDPPHPSILLEDGGALLLVGLLVVQGRSRFGLIYGAFVDGGGSLLRAVDTRKILN